MRRIYVIFSIYTKGWIRDKPAFFFSFIFPLLLLLIFASVFGGERVQTITIFVQNQDIVANEETDLSKIYVNVLNSTFKVEKIPNNVSALDYVKAKSGGLATFKIRILIIPKGFKENATFLALKENIKLQILNLQYLLQSNFINETEKQQIIQGLEALQILYSSLPNKTLNVKLITEAKDQDYFTIHGILSQINNAFLNRLMGINATMSINTELVTEKRITSVDYYLAGLLTAFVMTNGLFGTAPALASIRKFGVLKRFLATPLQKHEWFLGLVFSVMFINTLLLIEMLLVAVIVFKATVNYNIYWFILFYIGMFMFIGLGVFIGSIVKSVETATVLVNMIGFPMMFLSGAFWPLEIMPDYLQYVAKALPLYYFHTALRSLVVFGELSLVMNSFLIVIILSLLFTAVGVKFLKWKEP
jgi:ABC-2 type transport system permease protein